MTSITRNRSQGTLVLNGATATLRGGGYNLFFPGSAEKAIVRYGTQDPIFALYQGVDPCQDDGNRAIPAAMAFWGEGTTGTDFSDFFGACRENRCNFVRLFLTGGSIAGRTLLPFNAATVDGKIRYDVKGAVLGGRWNDTYFARLRAFVAAADAAGVVVQLSLFNYFDLVDDGAFPLKSWTLSFWRASNSLDAAWGSTHLIPELDAPNRQRFFVTPSAGNGLRAVQQEFIGRTVKAVAGLGNVILEVMNEPHGTVDINRVVEFDSYMTGLIFNYRRTHGSAALISINASYAAGQLGGTSDVDVWRSSGKPHFGEVDLVTYHGLTGFPPMGGFTACPMPCPTGVCEKPVSAPRVDGQAIADRAGRHFGAHPDKPMMYSTDAVRIDAFEHVYNGGQLGMKVRDGQIIVTPPLGNPDGDPNTGLRSELLRTRVFHWASKCLAQARQRPGKVHFHNHSTYRQGLVQVGQAASTFPLAGVAEPAPATV